VRRDRRVSFRLTVPGPGTIDVLETARSSNLVARADRALRPGGGRFAFASKHLKARGPTRFRITLKPSALGHTLVHHHVHPILLRLWVRYAPAGGAPRTVGRLGLHIPGT
jgi:hypothetical protein